MTEREKFNIADTKERIFKRDGYTCQYCKLSIHRKGTPQCAHLISQSKANIQKYGRDLIHSDHNMKSCCGLACNAALAVGKSREPKEAERIRRLMEETE